MYPSTCEQPYRTHHEHALPSIVSVSSYTLHTADTCKGSRRPEMPLASSRHVAYRDADEP